MLRAAPLRFPVLVASLTFVACGGGTATTDAGPDASPTMDAAVPDAPIGADARPPDGPCSDDLDGDGHRSIACGGDDCDDTSPERYPGAPEICDPLGRDEDCDPATLGPDRDGDHHVDLACCNTQPSGTLLCGDDCDDTRATVNPTAVEACNGIDDDCNGMIDDGITARTFYPDCDGDMFGSAAASGMTMAGCSAPLDPPASCGHGGWSALATDCDDTRASVNPGAPEICDNIDDNCDGNIDELVPGYFPDCDRDGYGGVGGHVVCALPSLPPTVCPLGGWSPTVDDCDDTVPTTHPLAPEPCNLVDDDCDGVVDGAPASLACGGPHSSVSTCTAGACTSTCVGAAVDCDGTPDCNDLTADPLHCGSCAHACGGPTCLGSVCTEDFLDIGEGGLFGCAARASGAVVCWGADNQGQFGLGAPHATVLGATDTGFTHAVRVAGSRFPNGLFTTTGAVICTIQDDATVRCAGSDDYGQCGTGVSTSNVFLPTSPVGLANVVQISVGSQHVCAVRGDHQLVCWGRNGDGQLGLGSTTPSVATVPTLVPGMTDVTQVSVGDETTCAVHVDHTVSCWGRNDNGEVGTLPLRTDVLSPLDVAGITDAAEVVVGLTAVCLRHTGGTVSCWGDGTTGALGNGSLTSSVTPVGVTGLTDAVELVAGRGFACARHATGHVACWGDGTQGELGNGTTATSPVPVEVSRLDDAVQVAGGVVHICARHASNVVTCWGANVLGMLDDGTMVNRNVPADVLAR